MINRIKSTNTSVAGIRPELAIAYTVACSVFNKFGMPCRITCGTDSKHGDHSKHYVGLAIDLGIKREDGSKFDVTLQQEITTELRRALGETYDVVLEGSHIHVEFDPAKYVA